MGIYGKVAIDAVNYIHRNPGLDPRRAWNMAILSNGVSAKNCSRTAYLGLAEDGYLLNIPGGYYLAHNNPQNKRKATRIRNHIYSNPPQIPYVTKKIVWRQIGGGISAPNYSLIDVVYSLFMMGFLL